LSRPFPSRNFSSNSSFTRVNGKIRAREVRLIGDDSKMIGVVPLAEALNMARTRGVDLVEVSPNAVPPVCRLVDYGKYRYEQSKKDKESKKHQHANRVKEVQLSPRIDPHDFGVKLQHAIDFLCEDMKVKVTLRFRGREMAHQEIGFGQVNNFLKELVTFAHADAPPKLIGKGINVMLTPLPKNKRAKNPRGDSPAPPADDAASENSSEDEEDGEPDPTPKRVPIDSADDSSFGQNPFASLDLNPK
jgi:translation initiation factor IF-3